MTGALWIYEELKPNPMKKTAVITALSFILLSSGIIFGIILIINLLNGNYLEEYYPYPYLISDPELYPLSAPPVLDSTYHYTRVTETGQTILKLCAISFISGITAIILPAIIPYIKKKW